MKIKTLLASAALSLLLGSNAFAADKLSIYHWVEYIPAELLEKFTAETGIEVIMDTYDGNESMLANLKAGKLGSYDVAVPGDYMVQIMIDEGILDSFSPSEMSNLGNIEPQWVDVSFDPGRKHSVPYLWGSTSFSVNRDTYAGNINSTAMLFDPPAELSGKINVLDSQNDVMALASLHLGIPQCTSDRGQLKALDELLQKAKVHWASFGSDVAKDVLVSGDAAVGMIWNGFSAKAREEGANVEYAYPDEGYLVWMDNVVLLKDAPNRAAALKFMNFLIEPENSAALANFAKYTPAVKGAGEFLDPALATMPEINPRDGAGAGVFVTVCDEATQKVYDQIWTRVRS